MSTAITSRVASSFRGNGFAPHVFLHIPPTAHTLSGFRAWVLSDEFPEKLKVMFLKGEVYLDMTFENLQYHALAKAEICRVLLQLCKEQDFGDFFLDGVLVTNERAKVSNNPDAVAVSEGSYDAARVKYGARKEQEIEITGSPDWVLEIVSTGSVFKDTVKLRQAYHEAGIQEYWLVDARGPEIKLQILHWRQGGYVAAPAKAGWYRSKVFARSFRLTRRHNRRGVWKYLLDVRE